MSKIADKRWRSDKLVFDRIDLFRIFARVVETADFTRAADTLKMPHSTISTAIQELEARVGTRLLARTTRLVSVTPNGAAFHDHCVKLAPDVEALFRRDKIGPQGVLRVNLPRRIGRLIVAQALPGFLERYPAVHIELGMNDRAVNLIDDSIDCVLRVGPLQDSGLIGRRIGDLALINVTSPAYIHRHGSPACPAELKHHHDIRYASPSSGRVEDWEWVQEGDARIMAVSGRVTVKQHRGIDRVLPCRSRADPDSGLRRGTSPHHGRTRGCHVAMAGGAPADDHPFRIASMSHGVWRLSWSWVVPLLNERLQ